MNKMIEIVGLEVQPFLLPWIQSFRRNDGIFKYMVKFKFSRRAG